MPGKLIENLFFAPFRIDDKLRNHVGVQIAPQFVRDERPFPAAAARPRPHARELRQADNVAQTPRLSRLHHPGILLPTVDHPLADIVGMRLLPITFRLTGDLDDLPVLANADRGIKRREPLEVARLMLDREDEIWMRRDGVGDLQIEVGANVELSKVPGPVKNHLVPFDAHFLAKELEQSDMAANRLLAVKRHGPAAVVVGSVHRVGLAKAQRQARQVWKTREDFRHLSADHFPRHRFGDVQLIAGLHLGAVLLQQAFGNHQDIGKRILGHAGLACEAKIRVDRRRLRVDPPPRLGSRRQELGVKGCVGDCALDKEPGHLPVEAPRLEHVRTVPFRLRGRPARIRMHHVEDVALRGDGLRRGMRSVLGGGLHGEDCASSDAQSQQTNHGRRSAQWRFWLLLILDCLPLQAASAPATFPRANCEFSAIMSNVPLPATEPL